MTPQFAYLGTSSGDMLEVSPAALQQTGLRPGPLHLCISWMNKSVRTSPSGAAQDAVWLH